MSSRKRLPIGYEDFKEIVDKNLYYVDKSMFIYELINNMSKNNLITRPRRFGKTLNFSMLRYFFDITEKDNAYLFDGLKISEYYPKVEEYRNAYPVITLSLKCSKAGSYDKAIYYLRQEIQKLFERYREVWDNTQISTAYKQEIDQIMSLNAGDKELGSSIKLLCECLKQYYNKNVIILIDEYDVPLEDAYFSGYYDKMVSFIRSLFESALKTNSALEFSVITGCLRISKESIFTGLNNLKVNSITSVRYSKYFGFEEYEVKDLLEYYGLKERFNDIQKWYDGYRFGKTEIYNPWSISYYVDELTADANTAPEAYWINTSSNSIIRELINHADKNTRADIENLVSGGSVETILKETITYGDLSSKNENIWSFLFFTGYLKVKSVRNIDGRNFYSLVIPNTEILLYYKEIILEYFNAAIRQTNENELYNALLSKNTAKAEALLNDLMKRTISYYDTKEAFYHGLLVGLLSRNEDYRVESNRETGDGRSDIVLYQEGYEDNAIILELKVCRKAENIRTIAAKALEQINERDYEVQARSLGYVNIFKYGIAFKGKFCCVTTE